MATTIKIPWWCPHSTRAWPCCMLCSPLLLSNSSLSNFSSHTAWSNLHSPPALLSTIMLSSISSTISVNLTGSSPWWRVMDPAHSPEEREEVETTSAEEKERKRTPTNTHSCMVSVTQWYYWLTHTGCVLLSTYLFVCATLSSRDYLLTRNIEQGYVVTHHLRHNRALRQDIEPGSVPQVDNL